MTPQNFARNMAAAQKEIDNFLDRDAPRLAGECAVSHFKENFRKGGFVNNGLSKWKPAKRQGAASGAAGRYGPLLSERNILYSSLMYRPSIRKVTITTPVKYAPVHNEGGTVSVTPKMRKYAWFKYYDNGGGKSKGAAEPAEAAIWKRLALTKKKKLQIPQRKFIGDSAELEKKIERLLQSRIDKILKR